MIPAAHHCLCSISDPRRYVSEAGAFSGHLRQSLSQTGLWVVTLATPKDAKGRHEKSLGTVTVTGILVIDSG